MPKFEGKARISKGINARKWKIPGGHYKLTGNLGGPISKKLTSSTGGVQFFSGKAH